MEKQGTHLPVMCTEVVEFLRLKPGKIILDCTLGGGGHSEAILEKISPSGRLIGIDQDNQALNIARERLQKYKSICTFVHGNFRNLDAILGKLKITNIDGVLFDLGISSFQLADASRGFSLKLCGPLDMRMDREGQSSTAYGIVNELSLSEIIHILRTFGEERWAKRIASRIVKEREKTPIDTTAQLREIIVRVTPHSRGYQRIHPATRTFQALRIAVNEELSGLEEGITKVIKYLNRQGRICVISFHSLEDRIVKHLFREFAQKDLLDILTRKPIRSTPEEEGRNPRSRSAKLRVGEGA